MSKEHKNKIKDLNDFENRVMHLEAKSGQSLLQKFLELTKFARNFVAGYLHLFYLQGSYDISLSTHPSRHYWGLGVWG